MIRTSKNLVPHVGNALRCGPPQKYDRTQSMKPVMALIIGGLVVALCVVGYLYYQRTSGDITIQLPKIELKK
jgi:hypothetical protein